ncbi:MAG TPA: GNAT family N-acetyltransferase [Jatrophihabitans sp.]|nr:GNAT family N-acetyltransferase [Jatrophihabitans sp.]
MGASPRWTGVRIARPATDLARSTTLYRDVLDLPVTGGFRNHDGYDGVFFALPGGGELELTAGPPVPVGGTEEDLLVLYVGDAAELRAASERLVAAGVPSVGSPNPYWNRNGRTFVDPDGYRIVIAVGPGEGEGEGDAGEPLEVDWYSGTRTDLRPLFELAEDSASQLDRDLDLGRVLVARRAGAVVGHLQLVDTERAGEVELKSMAVRPEEQRRGVGRALVTAATRESRAGGYTRLLVATAAADVGNLRFYQRLGFRFLSVERDAFTPRTGYPDPIDIEGIALRDRVWLSQSLVDG